MDCWRRPKNLKKKSQDNKAISRRIVRNKMSDEAEAPHELAGGQEPKSEPNERVANLEKEQFLESLRQYKHVAPRIGKFMHQKLYCFC